MHRLTRLRRSRKCLYRIVATKDLSSKVQLSVSQNTITMTILHGIRGIFMVLFCISDGMAPSSGLSMLYTAVPSRQCGLLNGSRHTDSDGLYPVMIGVLLGNAQRGLR